MTKQIVISDIRIKNMRYHTEPRPCVRIAFELLGPEGKALLDQRFDLAWELTEAEAAKFEQFIEKHIRSRLRQEVGLEEKAS